jgi:hypothetical protein
MHETKTPTQLWCTTVTTGGIVGNGVWDGPFDWYPWNRRGGARDGVDQRTAGVCYTASSMNVRCRCSMPRARASSTASRLPRCIALGLTQLSHSASQRRVLPALGPEGTPAQDVRQHGTLRSHVCRFCALRAQKTTNEKRVSTAVPEPGEGLPKAKKRQLRKSYASLRGAAA